VISLNTDDRKILWLLEFWFIQQVSSYYTGSTIKVESNNNIKNNEFKKFVFDIENITQLEINSMRSTLETKNRFLKERIKTNKDLIKILDRLEEPFIEEECQLLHEDSIHEDENGNT
jgi:predicted transcriptional regulator